MLDSFNVLMEGNLVRATADTIWRVPAYLPHVQPSLTDEIIAWAEKELGAQLPPAYVTLLKQQNGGYIRFSLPNMAHSQIAGIGPYLPSLIGFDWDDTDVQEAVSFPLHGLVPFDGDGHWYLCLDYRHAGTPSVTYVDMDLDQQSPIADSFTDYLTLLQIDDDDAFVVEAILELETAKATLSAALAIAFDPPDTWETEYPTHRARLGSVTNPEWLWLSPNVVARGFVPSDHPRYAELTVLLPGTAARFPELPANSYLLGTTPGVRSIVIDVCRREGFVVRPLRDYLS